MEKKLRHAASFIEWMTDGVVGPYSGVQYKSASADARKKIVAFLEEDDLMAPEHRAGNYWRKPQLEVAIRTYVDLVSSAAAEAGLLPAAQEIGFLKIPKDLLASNLHNQLRYVHSDNGDSLVHRCVRNWAAAISATERDAAIHQLRVLCIAGVDLTIVNSAQETPILLAIKLDADDPLRALLEFEAYKVSETPEGSFEPLLVAAEAEASRAFNVICGFVYENRMLSKVSFRRTDGGYTVLHLAAINDDVDVLQCALGYNEFKRRKLLDARAAKVNRSSTPAAVRARVPASYDMFQPALAKAARYGHFQSLRLLLEAGATADIADALGRTPLHIACIHGYVDCVHILLEYGANAALRDNRGRTAKDHCLLGRAHKKVPRQPLDVVLADMNILYRTDSKRSHLKVRIDFHRCIKLLEVTEKYGMLSGSSAFGWFLKFFCFPADALAAQRASDYPGSAVGVISC